MMYKHCSLTSPGSSSACSWRHYWPGLITGAFWFITQSRLSLRNPASLNDSEHQVNRTRGLFFPLRFPFNPKHVFHEPLMFPKKLFRRGWWPNTPDTTSYDSWVATVPTGNPAAPGAVFDSLLASECSPVYSREYPNQTGHCLLPSKRHLLHLNRSGGLQLLYSLLRTDPVAS